MQDPVLSRIHRVRGQVEAIERIYKSENCDCIELVEQAQAARSALGSIARILLSDEAKYCAEVGDVEELRRLITKTFRLF